MSIDMANTFIGYNKWCSKIEELQRLQLEETENGFRCVFSCKIRHILKEDERYCEGYGNMKCSMCSFFKVKERLWKILVGTPLTIHEKKLLLKQEKVGVMTLFVYLARCIFPNGHYFTREQQDLSLCP